MVTGNKLGVVILNTGKNLKMPRIVCHAFTKERNRLLTFIIRIRLFLERAIFLKKTVKMKIENDLLVLNCFLFW